MWWAYFGASLGKSYWTTIIGMRKFKTRWMNHVAGVLIYCLEKTELWKKVVRKISGGGGVIIHNSGSLTMMTMVTLIVSLDMMRLL